jgi:uncharacterized membrane protein
MDDQLRDYEEAKRAIYVKKKRKKKDDLDDFDENCLTPANKTVVLSDVIDVGTKVLIGGGLGLLAGVAAIAITASAAEVVVAGVITKITGVVGGAVGLSMGLNKFKKN